MGFIGEDRLKDLLTKIKSTFYTSSQVDDKIATAIGDITDFEITVVDALPTTGEKNKFYLVPSTTVDTNDFYNEYVWVESTSKFELVGSTAVDLTAYAKKTDLDDYAKTTSVPVVSDTYSATSTDAMSGKAVASAISNASNQVTVSQIIASGTEIAKISVNGNATSIYAPQSTNVTISSESGNAIVQKTDGIYVSDEGGKEVEVSDAIPTDDGIVLWVDTDEDYAGSYASVVEYHGYSTEEKVIGQWIDGKPIYRRYVTLSYNLPATTWFTVESSSLYNIDEPINFIGRRSKTCYYPICNNDGTNIMLYYPIPMEASTGYIIEYTKTTDAENSFDTTQLDYTVDDAVSDTDIDEVVDSL